MAIATTRTRLPLDRFFRIANVHPLHANQVTYTDIAEANFCGVPILQYSWQDADRTSREEIAETIGQVEERLEEYLNFAMRPTFFEAKPLDYPAPANPELFSSSVLDIRGLVRAVRLDQGYLIAGGRETKTFVGNFAVVYTDGDGDGYKETATITAAGFNAATVSTEIAVFYPGQSGDDSYEVRPVTTLSIVAGIATIVCRREQLVKSDLLFGLDVQAVDGADDAKFLATVDVYRRWLDPSQASVEFGWEGDICLTPVAYPPPLAYTVQSGALLIVEARLGWAALEAATWDSNTMQNISSYFLTGRMPDSIKMWFKAGYPLDSRGNMASIWERCVTYLTLASLWRPICQCSSLETFTNYWAYDLADRSSGHSTRVSRGLLENPLGTTRAASFVWDAVSRYRLTDD